MVVFDFAIKANFGQSSIQVQSLFPPSVRAFLSYSLYNVHCPSLFLPNTLVQSNFSHVSCEPYYSATAINIEFSMRKPLAADLIFQFRASKNRKNTPSYIQLEPVSQHVDVAAHQIAGCGC